MVAIVGDEPHGVANLVFVEFAEGPGAIHSAIHLVGFGRTGRAAEVADGAAAARIDVFHLASGDQLEGRSLQDGFDFVAE
jgi:hypothetical protein